MKKNYLFGALILVAVAVVLVTSYLLTAKKTRKSCGLPFYGIDTVITRDSKKDTVWHKVPDFRFINQQGDTVQMKSLEDKIIVADYFFTTCPGICKDMAKQMKRVYLAYKDRPEVVILSHTVDPETDSVPVLMQYALAQGVQDHSKWLFLTGKKDVLYRMARKGYLATVTKGDGGTDDFIHTQHFVLVDKNRNIRGIYDGTSDYEVNRLMFDIESLLKAYKDPI